MRNTVFLFACVFLFIRCGATQLTSTTPTGVNHYECKCAPPADFLADSQVSSQCQPPADFLAEAATNAAGTRSDGHYTNTVAMGGPLIVHPAAHGPQNPCCITFSDANCYTPGQRPNIDQTTARPH